MPLRMRRVVSSAPSKSLTTRTSQSWVTMPAAWESARLRSAGAPSTTGAVAERAALRAATRPSRRSTARGCGWRGPRRPRCRRAPCRRRGRRRRDAPGGERRDLGRRHRLHVEPGAEEHRLALVDEDQRRAVALLARDADVWGCRCGPSPSSRWRARRRRAGRRGSPRTRGRGRGPGWRGGRRARCRPAGAAGSRSRGPGASSAGEPVEVDVDARVGGRPPRPISGTATSLMQVGEHVVGAAPGAPGLVGQADAVAQHVRAPPPGCRRARRSPGP